MYRAEEYDFKCYYKPRLAFKNIYEKHCEIMGLKKDIGINQRIKTLHNLRSKIFLFENCMTILMHENHEMIVKLLSDNGWVHKDDFIDNIKGIEKHVAGLKQIYDIKYKEVQAQVKQGEGKDNTDIYDTCHYISTILFNGNRIDPKAISLREYDSYLLKIQKMNKHGNNK